MEASLESYFDIREYDYADRCYLESRIAEKHGIAPSGNPVNFEFFKFKAGDVVEIVEPSSVIGVTRDTYAQEYYERAERPRYIDDTIVSIGRKYVIKSVRYSTDKHPLGRPRLRVPDIHVYVDRPDEIAKLRQLEVNDDSTWVNYFSLRPVPTKEDLDLNKLSPDKLARYTELVNEYDKVINARAHQDRIEQDILDLFNIPNRNKEEVLDMIKERVEEK